MTLKQTVKKALPAGTSTRRLPAGIGRGLKLSIDLRDGWLSTYLGLYEMELNRYLRELCPPRASSFDLGGHIGYDALVLAHLSGAQVVSVEADARYCRAIRGNLLANPGLADQVTVLESYVSDGTDGPDGAANVTIDGLASDFFVPDFIKMDIEGGEVAALRGAAGTLSERKPNLLIEVHSEELERTCLALLRTHGYHPKLVDQRRFLRDHRPIAHNRWIVAAGRPSPMYRTGGST